MVRVKLPEHVQRPPKSKWMSKTSIKDDLEQTTSIPTTTSTQDWFTALQQTSSSMTSNRPPVAYPTRSYSAANLYPSIEDSPVVSQSHPAPRKAVAQKPVMSSSSALPHPPWTHESYKDSSANQPAMVYFASVEEDLEAQADGSEAPGGSLRSSIPEKQGKPPIDLQSNSKGNQSMLGIVEIETKDLRGIYPNMMRRKQTARKAVRRDGTVKANAKGKIVKV